MIGIHINKAEGNLEDAIEKTWQDGWETGQVFLWVPQKLSPVKYEAKAVREAIGDRTVYVHSSYLISPWGAAKYNLPLCMKQLKQQAEICPRGGVVFHLPNKPAKDFLKILKFLIEKKPPKSTIILENKAFLSDNNTAKPEEINSFIKKAIEIGIPRGEIHLCIDTAHLTSAGIPFTTLLDVEKWLKALEFPECIRMFHLNGNSSTKVHDIHEVPGSPQDLTWGQGDDSGLKTLIQWAKKNKKDCIVECHYQRPGHHVQALEFRKKYFSYQE
jgi:endonuclease IV